jgi:hypothetical protein
MKQQGKNIISVWLLLYSIAGIAIAQQPASRLTPISIKYVDPAKKRLDSLKTLFTGTAFAIRNNPANAILAANTGRTGTTARTQNACGYFCTPSVVLPVTGLDLQGGRINETQVRLTWKTYTEFNNYGFDIERQFNGSASYYKTSFVRGVGNTVSTTHYQTIDANSFEGITYYRLRQVDIDSQYKYSNIIAIKGIIPPPGLQVYPNPGSAITTIFQLKGFKNGEMVAITITDVVGRILVHKTGYPVPGQFTISLQSLARLPAGFYTIIATNDSKKVSTGFVITE